MRRGQVTLCFYIFIWLILGTLVVPPVFKFFDRITPWVFGLPFSVFWLLTVCVLVSITLIVWYFVEDKRGELD